MKKQIIVFLSLFMFISAPFHANANIISTGGKYLLNTVKQTPSAVVVSAKNTATGATHVAKHGVSSNQLAAAIGGGLVGMAVTGGVGVAFEVITGLALDAVDWVMDAENNQLKWKEKTEGGGGLHAYKAANGPGGSTPAQAASAGLVKAGVSGDGVTCYTDNNFTYSCKNSRGQSIVVTKDVSLPQELPWKKIPLPTLAQKTIDLSKSGNPAAVKTIEKYVTDLFKNGELDKELDESTDITKDDKECSAGYEKVNNICVKKVDLDKDKICPPDSVRVGDKCIKKPERDPDNPQQCGDCCDELTAILLAMAEMNAQFYENSLDNDAQMLVNLKLVNDQLDAVVLNFNELLEEAKKTNQTLTEINNNQELHFNELKQKADELKDAVETGNADILAKLAEVQAAIDLTNLKLDQVNLNLDKINENLEKMQKCEETEFNKKICDFIDWVKQEPDASEENPVEVKEVKAENSNKIDMAGECPAPYQLNFDVLGYQQNHSISYEPLCGALVLLKPIFVGSGALSGMFILMGYSRASNTGVNG